MSNLFIDLRTDFAFKYIFLNPENKDLVIHLLNHTIPLSSPVVDIEVLNAEVKGETPDARNTVFDLYCKAENQERFIVEIQRKAQKHFVKRSVYYASTVITSQGEKGEEWGYDVKRVYVVCLLDFTLPHTSSDKYSHHVQLMETTTCEVFTDTLTFVYYELTKFSKNLAELMNDQDKWLFCFRGLSSLDYYPEALNDGIFKKLLTMAEISNLSDRDRMFYFEELKRKRDRYAVEQYMIEENQAIGEARGEARGELKRARQVAVKMIQAGKSDEEIILFTDLSKAELDQVKRQTRA